jgi:hypothetical protein
MELARMPRGIGFRIRAASEHVTMSVSTLYTPFGVTRRPSTERAHFFVMNCLLYSRMEAGFPTNDAGFDEDVNVYLAGLLTSVIDPRPGGWTAASVVSTDAALREKAEAAPGPREKCRLYRSNADRILVSLGIFKNARLRRPDSVPHLDLAASGWVGRGKAYYAIARSYDAQARRRETALGEVLGKLSANFERYLAVLSLMGGEHLNIFRRISDGEVFHLERASRSSERRAELALRYDRFLDLYSGYLRSGTARAGRALEAAAGAIREIDPAFSFDLGKRGRIRSV